MRFWPSGLILCCVSFVMQASVLDSFAFDPFSFQQDDLTAPEVDIGRRQVVDALVVAQVIVVGDEGSIRASSWPGR